MTRENLLELTLERAARQCAIQQVRPIVCADQLQRVPQPQLSGNVAPYAGCCRRGECVKACAGQQVAKPPELPILGPEVMPPLADAVRLVNRDEAHAAGGEAMEKHLAALSNQPLGRDVQQA